MKSSWSSRFGHTLFIEAPETLKYLIFWSGRPLDVDKKMQIDSYIGMARTYENGLTNSFARYIEKLRESRPNTFIIRKLKKSDAELILLTARTKDTCLLAWAFLLTLPSCQIARVCW